VFAFGIAGMLASGLFLLPGLIYSKVGSSILLVYLAAGICILPTVFSKVELATAMPRSGGAYYVIDRSLGPAHGVEIDSAHTEIFALFILLRESAL